MAAAKDPVTEVVEAMKECLDTRASVTAVTGRSSKNIVPFAEMGRRGDTKPVIGYSIVVSTPDGGAVGEWWQHQIDLTCEASTYEVARALRYVVKRDFTCATLAANTTHSLDARVDTRQLLPDSTDPTEAMKRCGLAVTITVNHG